MRALLLAAGLGTRLRPITNTTPKCLVKINGRPLLDYWIELLAAGGIGDILVNTHYMAEVVEAHVGTQRCSANITTVFEERLLGTAGTALRNRSFFGEEPFMLVHADNLSLFDPKAFIKRFENGGAQIDLTLMTFRTDAPESCGIVALDKDGIVQEFYEKPKVWRGNLANAAVYILSQRVIDFIETLGKNEVDFSTEVLPHFTGRMNTFHNDIYHRDIGTAESLAAAQVEYPMAAARAQFKPVSQ